MKYHTKKIIVMVLLVAALNMGLSADIMAEEPENNQTPPWQLEPITVYDTTTDTINAFLAPLGVLAPSNQESYTKKSLETFGRQGNINVFKIVEMSPSVNYTAVDALGTNENGFHDSIRIRGKKRLFFTSFSY